MLEVDRFPTATLLVFITLLSGCGSAPATSTPVATDEKFSNILVLAIADNYDGRAQYERTVASRLRQLGVAAMPYHQAVGGSGNISSERSLELVAEHGFDAILVTQVRDAHESVDVAEDTAGSKVVRKQGQQPADFFRYDYEELDEPGEISILAAATLDTDLHRADGGEILWSFHWTSKGAENVGILIDESSTALVRRLDRDKFIRK